jgi:aldose 1-epimerase
MNRIAMGLAVLMLAACSPRTEEKVATITKESFGKTSDGVPVDIYTLRNSRGLETKITNYGGIVVSLMAPDRTGQKSDIVLGFDSLDGYLKTHPYFGAIIGRYGNRIGGGRFKLDGVEYKLAKNNGENALHGGLKGFDKVVWNARVDGHRLELTYRSKDGEEGYPGNLDTTVVYSLTDDNELKIDYSATSDKATVINLTNHSYFNLSGDGDILGHEVKLHADRFTPVDAGLIPLGELRPVKGTPFDFTSPTTIGARINDADEQLKLGKGYDHNFVLNTGAGAPVLAAEVYEPKTGRTIELRTTEPGVQFYTGNFLDGTIRGKGGRVYGHRSGFCLETQHFPDSPNKPQFPSAVLKPGERYQSTTIYRFGVR